MIYSCTVKPVYRHQKDKPILSNSILKVSTCEQLYTSDFKIQRRGRQQERQKNNRFNKQNNNFPCASRLFAHFFALFA